MNPCITISGARQKALSYRDRWRIKYDAALHPNPEDDMTDAYTPANEQANPFVSIWRKVATAMSHLAAHTPLNDDARDYVTGTVADLHALGGAHEAAVNDNLNSPVKGAEANLHPIHDDIASMNTGEQSATLQPAAPAADETGAEKPAE